MATSPEVVPHLRPEHHHRDIQGGAARAAIFGVSDGLVSNVSLILGMAGCGSTQPNRAPCRARGSHRGSVSMAAGEFVSMQGAA